MLFAPAIGSSCALTTVPQDYNGRLMALAPGTKLGPYEYRRTVGCRWHGRGVSRAGHALGPDVAVKVLPANLSSDPNLRQRLEREAKVVSKLSHPHICILHDIGQQDGMDFLVMELLGVKLWSSG